MQEDRFMAVKIRLRGRAARRWPLPRGGGGLEDAARRALHRVRRDVRSPGEPAKIVITIGGDPRMAFEGRAADRNGQELLKKSGAWKKVPGVQGGQTRHGLTRNGFLDIGRRRRPPRRSRQGQGGGVLRGFLRGSSRRRRYGSPGPRYGAGAAGTYEVVTAQRAAAAPFSR